MTTTPAKGRQPRAAAPAARGGGGESEWSHGPVAAAINASIVALLLAALIRLTNLPSGLALLVGAVMAVALVAAGNMRKPRPLALRSLVYRATAMVTAGIWLWFQTADFTKVSGGALTGLLCCVGALGGVVAVLVAVRYGRGLVAVGLACASLAAGATGVPLLASSNVLSLFVESAPVDKADYLPWLWHATVSLSILTAVFAVLGAACANHEAEMDDTLARTLMMRSHGREMLAMQNLLRATVRSAPNARVVDFDRWANGAGEDYIIDGTLDGLTPEEINAQRDTLASRLDLPLGCGVEAVQGASRGRIVVAVSRVNRIKDDHRYPVKYVQRTIYNGIPIGVLRDGTEVEIKLRESSAFVWGQKRSGKTTVLYDVIAGLCQCTDAVIWVIDLGGGGAAIPFLYSYAEGRTGIPVIDWVATTVAEAQRMADAALRIALDRKVFYKHRKRASKTNLLPLDSEVPEIVIVIDEGAEIMGENQGMSYEAKQVREVLEKVVRTAGDSGVNIVFSGLAATGEVIDRFTLAQLAIRVGMRVSEGRELAYGFDSDYGLNPQDIPYQGSGFVKPSHDAGTRVFKAYLIEPDQMDEVAEVTAEWRPVLDERGRQVAGEVYEQRWQRTAHLLTDEEGNVLIDPVNGGLRAVADKAPANADPVADAPAAPPAAGAGGPMDGMPAMPPASPIPQAPGPMMPGAVPPPGQPATPTAGGAAGLDEETLKAGLRPFIVPGSPDDVLRRADESAARLEAAAEAASGQADDGMAADALDLNDDSAVDQRFEELMKTGFDWSRPESWPEPTPPPSVETQNNPNGPGVLEALVRHHGAEGVTAKEIKEKLPAGGPWGPMIRVSPQTIHDWLAPGRKPAPWLAPRRPRAPYVHRDFAQPGT